MSISPQEGQPTVLKLSPNIHNAGQTPPPDGCLALISTFPYLNENLSLVSILAEVKALPM
ncbi:hypothetical protein D3C86_1421450 [compost metagenome]